MSDTLIDIKTFKDYFESLAELHRDIASFCFGDSQRVIGNQKAVTNYPVLFLETPNFKAGAVADAFSLDCYCAFSIASTVPPDDYEGQDVAWQDNLVILLEVLRRMRKDQRTTPFLMWFDMNDVTIDPIASWMADNNYGWRAEFKLRWELTSCVDDVRWNDM